MNLIIAESSRYDKLKGWLMSHGLTIREIAGAVGLGEATARWRLVQENIDQKLLDPFLALGIPKSLLPSGKTPYQSPHCRTRTPGRKADAGLEV